MPITPVDYQPLPYVRSGTLGTLIGLRGQHQSEALLRAGEIQAKLWSDLGQNIAQGVTSYAKQQQEAPYRQAQVADLKAQADERARALSDKQATDARNQQIDSLMKDSLTTDPQTGMTTYDRDKLQSGFVNSGIGHLWPQYSELVDKSDASLKTLKDAHRNAIVDVAKLVDASGNDPVVFANEIQRGVQNKLFTPQEAAPYLDAAQRDPSHIAKVTAAILGKKPDLMAVPAGEPVIDKNNPAAGAVFTAPAKPTEPSKETEWVTRGGKAIEIPKGTSQAGDVPYKAADANTPQTMADLTDGDQKIVDAIKDYRQSLPTGIALTRGKWPALLEAAHVQDPTFDQSQYQVRQRLKSSFASGPDANNIRSLNTAIGHLGSVASAMDAMGNGNWESVNAAKDMLATHLPVTPGLVKRQGLQTKVRVDFNAVKGELAGIFKASGATDSEIKSWQDTMPKDPAAATPEERKAFLESTVELMGSRMGANRQKYETGMGGKPFPGAMLSPNSRQILGKLGIDVNKIDPTGSESTSAGPKEGDTKPIDGYPGTEQTYRNGKWIRTK